MSTSPAALCPNRKLNPSCTLARMQLLFQDSLRELSRRHQRQIPSEGKHKHRIDPRALEPTQLLRVGVSSLNPASGFKILVDEVQRDRDCLASPARARVTISPRTCECALCTPSKFPTLTKGRAEFGGYFVEFVKDLHRQCDQSPEFGSRTPSTSRRAEFYLS